MTALDVTHRALGHEARPQLGRICFLAGLAGAASGLFLAVVPAAVADDRYSYPLSPGWFVAIQVWFVVQHLGLLAGIVGLGRSGAAGAHRRGIQAAVAGMALLTVVEVAAIGAARSPYPDGWRTGILDVGYGVATILVGAGLLFAGIAVVRRRVWRGRSRWLPLATGLYVFVPMFPLMFGGFLAARLAIGGWMLLFAGLGWALIRESAE